MSLFALIFFVAILGISYATFNYVKVKRLDEGTEEMSSIALKIRKGAKVFVRKESKVLLIVVGIVTIVLGVFINFSSAVTFLIGVLINVVTLAGMSAATYANVRVTNEARKTKSKGRALKVGARGGSVMGLNLPSVALIGGILLWLLFRNQFYNLGGVENWCGIRFEPFSMTISSYALGCSVVAMFNRVGGGIFTKGADMGGDLVGKAEEKIPEDDHRNPAVIADAVGDDVNEVEGFGSDLLESHIASIVSSIVLVIFLFNRYNVKGLEFSRSVFEKLCMYPVLFVTIGLLSCIIGLIYFFAKKEGNNLHKELNVLTWISAGLTAGLNLIMTILLFKGESFGDLPFKLGSMSPFVSALFGIVSGIAIGMIAEYYTSYEYNPTKRIAEYSKEGAAITVTQGLSVGMKSTLLSVAVVAMASMAAYSIAGPLGAPMAAVGMLSFVGVIITIDVCGAISDNSGGIAEMCKLGNEVREITDELDSVGNTRAAIGKGEAIGSAAFAAISLMISYLYAFSPIDADVTLDLMNPQILAGTFIGAAIPYYFSGILIESVTKTARKMVDEVRRQFREIVGLREDKADPDYEQCIGIATQGALSEMKVPALIAIVAPVVCGFLFGPEFVAGILMGSTVSAVMLAVFCGNSGGAWDNSKKFIESQGKKGLFEHIAAVIGDTVGDPLKDTVGPSLDILIKIMIVVALIMAPIFSKYNLLDFIFTLIN